MLQTTARKYQKNIAPEAHRSVKFRKNITRRQLKEKKIKNKKKGLENQKSILTKLGKTTIKKKEDWKNEKMLGTKKKTKNQKKIEKLLKI